MMFVIFAEPYRCFGPRLTMCSLRELDARVCRCVATGNSTVCTGYASCLVLCYSGPDPAPPTTLSRVAPFDQGHMLFIPINA